MSFNHLTHSFLFLYNKYQNIDEGDFFMYTVLLVDDEPVILRSLSDTIMWEQFGVSTLLTASDGVQALELLTRHSVDLLITDIKMPHMDGLTLLKKVRETYPEVHCILLTAYSEFEYAKTAILLGVENYLLKPFHKEEVEETIEIALENIYRQKKVSHYLFRNNILLRWLNGSITDEELSERGNLLGLNLYLPEYCVFIIKKIVTRSFSSYWQQCARLLAADYEVYYLKDDHKHYTFILGGKRIDQKELFSLLRQTAESFHVASDIVIAFGGITQSAGEVSKSYLTASSLLETYDPSDSKLFLYNQNLTSEQTTNKLIQVLSILFHQGETEDLDQQILDFTDKILQMTAEDPELSILSMLSTCLCRLFAQEFPNYPDAQEQLKNRLRLLTSSDQTEDLHMSIADLLRYSHLLFHYYIKQLSPIVQSSIRYIHKHYAEGISIQEFCSKNKMNSAYLGYLFKKETGFFFNTYLAQYRICCSIPLLLDSSLKINDIAQKVGFSYPSYYISCFRKHTGQSPTKYRQKQG